MKMGDYTFSVKLRDLIRKMIAEEIERRRPVRYGEVHSIDRPNRNCYILFTASTTPVKVPMGSVQPKETGQIVRVEGYDGDWFITDVMGPAHYVS